MNEKCRPFHVDALTSLKDVKPEWKYQSVRNYAFSNSSKQFIDDRVTKIIRWCGIDFILLWGSLGTQGMVSIRIQANLNGVILSD